MRFLTFFAAAVFGLMVFGGEKPSPFAARTSAPAVAPAAPVSPVVPTGLLRGARPRPFVASVPVVAAPPPAAMVAPTGHRPALQAELPAPPAIEPAAPKVLKTQALPVPEMVVAQIKPPQVDEIEKGAGRNEVVAKLGNPVTAISMYEDGRFQESLRFEWKGKWLGTVRLVDGHVARVERP